ncbi:MAG: hypothetical protein AAF337_11400 [Pseudomonadota bacterium]
MTAANVRRYQLHFGPDHAFVRRTGPEDVLRIGLTKPVDEAAALAGLLFAVCPRAHQVAVLRAAEDIAGITLPRGQVAARDIVVLGEAVFCAVWRAALSWARLLKTEVPVAAVQNARLANDALSKAVFKGPWACIGGSPLEIDAPALSTAIDRLSQAFRAIRPLGEAVIASAAQFKLRSHAGAALDEKSLVIEPGQSVCFEETPRTLLDGPQRAANLAPWFEAQLDHAASLVARLHEAKDLLEGGSPVEAADDLSGRGTGVVMTARGRLRHTLTLDAGRINGWSAMAPTDWNFADNGPAASAAAQLEAPGPDAANWLVAAFDPCAPCEVVMEVANA